jgi:hypothetical protein
MTEVGARLLTLDLHQMSPRHVAREALAGEPRPVTF